MQGIEIAMSPHFFTSLNKYKLQKAEFDIQVQGKGRFILRILLTS